MYDSVLVPTDGSDAAEQALDHALAIADRFDASLHTIHVVQAQGVSDTLDDDEFEDVLDRLDGAGEEAVEQVRERATETGKTDVDAAVRRGVPEAEIRRYIDEHDIDVVVMATEGRTGTAREMIGSVTEDVIRSCSVPVLTVNVGNDS